MASFGVEESVRFAIAHHRAGRLAEAEAIYRQVLKRSPGHAETLAMLGALTMQTGRLSMAAELLSRAAAAAPNSAQIHCNLGECLRRLADFEGAIASLRRAIELEPALPVAHNNLGITLADKGFRDEAIAAYRKAIWLNPEFGEAHSNLGNALRARGDLAEAIAACREAVRCTPEGAKHWNSLGVALAESGALDQARQAYERAIELERGYAEAHTNLANLRTMEGRVEQGLAGFRRAVELAPESVPAHWNLAVALLRKGDFKSGWEEHEWRLKARSQFPVRPFPQPQWNGEELRGRTILLHAEQGFGDTIQFVRYVPYVARRGGRVILECQPELCWLLEGMAGAERVIARGEPVPQFDVHCPLLSLPRAFQTDLGTIPASVPYIRVGAEAISRWAAKVTSSQGMVKVGVCWAGNPTHSNDAHRSIDVKELSVLASDRVAFYSLQRREPGQPAPELPGELSMIDFGDQLIDFVDTAALILNLDLVICVDTAVAHLAGALGKPVWVLLPFMADWRWLMNREDTPWYPTMRLFRQRVAADWREMLERAGDVLRAEM